MVIGVGLEWGYGVGLRGWDGFRDRGEEDGKIRVSD